MPRQYTFKTTRDTEWLEEHLDKLPSSERSRYIRMALVLLFDNVRPAVTLGQSFVPPKVTQTSDTRTDFIQEPFEYTPKPKRTISLEEPTIVAQDEDLDSKLNNLFD